MRLFRIKYLLFIIFLLAGFSNTARAKDQSFVINSVVADCGISLLCQRWQNRFKELEAEYSDFQAFQQFIKLYLLEGGIEDFRYRIIKTKDKHILDVKFSIKPVVSKIYINYIGNELDYLISPSILMIKEGSYLDLAQIEESVEVISKHLNNKGYLNSKTTYQVDDRAGNKKVISFNIELGKPILISSIDLVVKSKDVEKIVQRRLVSFLNNPLDIVSLKETLKEIRKEFFNVGYYFNSLELIDYKQISQNKVVPRIRIIMGEKYLFSFHGNKVFDRRDFLIRLRERLKKSQNTISPETLKRTFLDMYQQKSFYSPEIKIKITEGKNLERYVYVEIIEGLKLPVVGIEFKGNSNISTSELKELYYKHAYDLAARNYYDEKYYKDFVGIIRKHYLSKGYVLVKVFDPQLNFATNNDSVKVGFQILEGVNVKIKTINLIGLPAELDREVRDNISFREDEVFNPLNVDSEIKSMLTLIRNKGYYYASLRESDYSEIVSYAPSYNSVALKFDIDLRQKIYLGRVVILGNLRTKQNVVLRELTIKRGEIMTPDAIQLFKNRLISLGIFSRVKVTPLETSSMSGVTDLLVSLRETDSTIMEVAPGYRTDIGLKFSGGVSLVNRWGRGTTLSLKGQVNRRFGNSAFDYRRRIQNKKKLEYNTRIAYNVPYVFNKSFDYNVSSSAARKRFYSFDANIIRITNTISKNLTRSISTSLRHQYETISQYDETDIADRGNFKIGSVTPSLTFDYRDNKVNPIKGVFSNFSFEWANPAFLIKKEADQEINFYRWIARNRFYIPMPNGVFAISAAMGYEKNLVKGQIISQDGSIIPAGSIPRIKAFRLSGVDRVRGFNDTDINRLPNGKDINEVTINDDAYFANVKLEPRYFIDDNIMLGVFVDAGRVYVSRFDPESFRSSTGITFKYITPVGALNFDYGFKLHRRRLTSGELEEPSRFHASIGFF